MGSGIGSLIRGLAPLSLYLGGLASAAIAMSGNVRWALMLITFLLPLRNVTDKVQAYPLGTKYLDILISGMVIGWLFNKKPQGSKIFEKSSINVIAIITVIYMFFSLIWGGYFLYGNFTFDIHDPRVQDWKNFSLMPLLFFIHLNNNNTKKEVWTIFAVICCGIFVVDYYTLNQIRWHPSALLSREQLNGTFQFLGPNEVAAFFNQNIVILISVVYVIKKGRNKSFLLILILLSLYCIMFLYSRGAYAGLMAGLLVLFAVKDQKLLIPLILVLLFWQNVLPQDVVDRIKETRTASGQLDESSQNRIDIWKQAFIYFNSNPIIGIGWGSFRHMGLILGDTHNIYVKFLAEQGLIGITIFLVTLFCFIKEGWQLYQKGDDDLSKALGLGFVCCIFVVMVNNIFGDRWSYLEPNSYLWIFAGLVARLNVISRNPRPADETVPQNIKPATKNNLPKIKKKVRYYDL